MTSAPPNSAHLFEINSQNKGLSKPAAKRGYPDEYDLPHPEQFEPILDSIEKKESYIFYTNVIESLDNLQDPAHRQS